MWVGRGWYRNIDVSCDRLSLPYLHHDQSIVDLRPTNPSSSFLCLNSAGSKRSHVVRCLLEPSFFGERRFFCLGAMVDAAEPIKNRPQKRPHWFGPKCVGRHKFFKVLRGPWGESFYRSTPIFLRRAGFLEIPKFY